MPGFDIQFSRADIVIRGMRAGVDIESIAGCLGITRQALYMWIAAHREELAAYQPRPTRPTTTRVAVEAVASGVRVTEAAKLAGNQRAAVTDARRRAGIASRYRDRVALIVADYHGGMSAKEVATKHECTVGAVHSYSSRSRKK